MAAGCGTPVIWCGGVSSREDALAFMQAGAWAVQVGSAAMDEPAILGRIADCLMCFLTHYRLVCDNCRGLFYLTLLGYGH